MKIIHCADLHLGSKIEAKLKPISDERKTAVRTTFKKMVEYANTNDIKIILLSGDIFDSDKPAKKDKSFFYSVVKNNSNIDFLYLRGNHDSLENYEEYSNLKTFTENWKSYSYDNLVISGIEMSSSNYSAYYSTLSLDSSKLNIVMLHGQTSSTVGMNNIKLSKLTSKNIDYLALGHVHKHEYGKLDERGNYAYSGCLEPRGFDEIGEKGFILLDINNNKISNKFIPFSQKTIYEINVDVTGLENASDIIDKVENSLNNDKENIYRINIVGEINYNVEFNKNDLLQYLKDYYFIDIKIKTTRLINPDDFKNDLSLRGEFVRKVYEKDLSDEEKKEIASYGLRILDGRGIEL